MTCWKAREGGRVACAGADEMTETKAQIYKNLAGRRNVIITPHSLAGSARSFFFKMAKDCSG
jgi:hypothetical protein